MTCYVLYWRRRGCARRRPPSNSVPVPFAPVRRRLLGGILLFVALFTYLLLNGYYEDVNKMYTRVPEPAPGASVTVTAAK
jgi:hypothetical protein